MVLTRLCLGVTLYHALTRAVIHDEAQSWQLFLRDGGRMLFDPTVYTTNNHILHTVLCCRSIELFGPSHWGMRLPALCGSFIYIWGTGLLCRRLLGATALALLTQGLLTFNPLIFDLLSLARGYSLALAFFLVAFALLLLALRTPAPSAQGLWRLPALLRGASLAMGCSVATHSYFAIANGALATTYLALALVAEAGPPRRRSINDFAGKAVLTILPGALLVGLVWGPLFRGMLRVGQRLFDGRQSLLAAARDLAELTLGLKAVQQGLLANRPEWGPRLIVALALAAAAILGAATLALTAGRARRLRRCAASPAEAADLPLCLAGGTFLLGLLLIVAAHGLGGIQYPAPRFLSPFIFLFLIWVALAAAHPAWSPPFRRRFRPVIVTAGAILLCWQVYVGWPGVWYNYEADTLQIARRLDDYARQRGGTPLRVDADWILAPCLDYYKDTLGLRHLAPIHANSDRVAAPGFDAYVLPDRAPAEAAGLTLLYRGAASGACVAIPEKAQEKTPGKTNDRAKAAGPRGPAGGV